MVRVLSILLLLAGTAVVIPADPIRWFDVYVHCKAPQRTRIVDGEIVREDELRAGQTQASSVRPSPTVRAGTPAHTSAHSGPPSGGQTAFDFSAPPIVLAREPPEQSLFGMPGLRVFGAHFQSRHLAALLAATVFLGLRGLLLGAAAWVVYKLWQKQSEIPAGRTGGQTPSFQLPGFLQQGFPGGPASEPPQASQPGRPNLRTLNAQQPQQPFSFMDAPGSGGGSSSRSSSRDPWAGKGKGHKLGSSP